MRKMLPRSHCCAYVGHDEGSKSVKYYNAETRTVLTSQNYKFLIPSNSSPPEVILIDPESKGPQLEGEHKENACKELQIIPDKDLLDKDQPERPEEIKTGLTRPIQRPRMDYRFLNDPFPDEEEANIAFRKDEAFTVLAEDDP